MNSLMEIQTSERMLEDVTVLAALIKLRRDHTIQQIHDELGKIWPFSFEITSVSNLNLILRYFSVQQREQYISGLYEYNPDCSSREWVDFLAHCSSDQCDYFLKKLSIHSCADLYGESGLFVLMVTHAHKFSFDQYQKILAYTLGQFPDLVPVNFNIAHLRFGGDYGRNKIKRIHITLDSLEPKLSSLTLPMGDIVEVCSINIGMIYDDKSHWEKLVKTYFLGLAAQLPRIFHNTQAVQKFYSDLAQASQRDPSSSGTIVRTIFTPEYMQNEFAQATQICLNACPNLSQFADKYSSDSASLIGLLVRYAIESSSIYEVDHDPLQNAFRQFIQQRIDATTIRTSYAVITNLGSKSPEECLIEDLSKLDPLWLSILNDHVVGLNWQPFYTERATQACFRTSIQEVKASYSRQNHAFFLKTLIAWAVSTALVILGLLMLRSSLPPVCGAVLMISGALLGFFTYKARSDSEGAPLQNGANNTL